MTDKERLETIKELVKKIESILYDEWRQQELTNLIESLYYADHINWLINRVEELENRIANDEHFVAEILEQNKRYREVINQIKNNIPLEFKHISEYEAKKNVIRLINIDNLVNEYLEDEE